MGKKLLFSLNKKDFTVQTFKAGGPGGQHQNKTDSAVRITNVKFLMRRIIMNRYCKKDCKHKGYCRLNEINTEKCKVCAEEDGLIFGRTWKEIQDKQTKKNK